MRRKLGIVAVVITMLAAVTAFNYKFNNPPLTEEMLKAQTETEDKLAQQEALMKQKKERRASATIRKAAQTAQAADTTPVPPMPDTFKLQFACSNGTFVAEFYKEWAPIGVAHLWELVHDNYYNDARFFRVISNFMAQFGLAADPVKTAKWRTSIKDDPANQKNLRGVITYAQTSRPNSRSTQLFINFKYNSDLDAKYIPIGKVLTGMDVVDGINDEYGDAPSQGQGQTQITQFGNTFLDQTFPNLDYIKTITVLDAEPTSKEDDADEENPHAEDDDAENGDNDDATGD